MITYLWICDPVYVCLVCSDADWNGWSRYEDVLWEEVGRTQPLKETLVRWNQPTSHLFNHVFTNVASYTSFPVNQNFVSSTFSAVFPLLSKIVTCVHFSSNHQKQALILFCALCNITLHWYCFLYMMSYVSIRHCQCGIYHSYSHYHCSMLGGFRNAL